MPPLLLLLLLHQQRARADADADARRDAEREVPEEGVGWRLDKTGGGWAKGERARGAGGRGAAAPTRRRSDTKRACAVARDRAK